MIFITLGSQKFQFNRLLEEVDKLLDEKKIDDIVFAQIGHSTYKPKNFKYQKFLGREEFIKTMKKCDLVITHAGTGAIVTALKHNKNIIAVPRLASYHEHVDNHQKQIAETFRKLNFIECIGDDISMLSDAIKAISGKKFKSYTSNTQQYLDDISNFIDEEDATE